jgi:dTDP-4-amino-4,6-dideoxygalactose transaminase
MSPRNIEILPRRAFASLRGRSSSEPTVFEGRGTKYLSSGRVALQQTVRRLTTGQADEVLLPAYHCTSMVDAVRAAPATPVFYRVNADLSPQLDDLAALITPRTRAVVLVHYFGWPQSASDLKRLCSSRDIKLIEDCAHTLYGTVDGVPVGRAGDAAVASLRKFFPLYDGGAIYMPGSSEVPVPIARQFMYELRAAYNTCWAACASHRADATAVPEFESRTEQGNDDYVDARFTFDMVARAMSVASRAVFAVASRSRLVERRRASYRDLAARLAGRMDMRALHDGELPRSVVPYVFPLLLGGDSDAAYRSLRSAGVRAHRWEELRTDRCAQSNFYARCLVQLPCHQELDSLDIARMADAVCSAVSNSRAATGGTR